MSNRIVNAICTLLVISFIIWNYSGEPVNHKKVRNPNVPAPIINPVFNELEKISPTFFADYLKDQKEITSHFLALQEMILFFENQILEMEKLRDLKITYQDTQIVELLKKQQHELLLKHIEPVLPSQPKISNKEVKEILETKKNRLNEWVKDLVASWNSPEPIPETLKIDEDEVEKMFQENLNQPQLKLLIIQTLWIINSASKVSLINPIIKSITDKQENQTITEVYLTNGFDLLMIQSIEPQEDAPFMPSNKAVKLLIKLNNKPVLDFNAALQPDKQIWHSVSVNKYISGTWVTLLDQLSIPLSQQNLPKAEICEKDCFF